MESPMGQPLPWALGSSSEQDGSARGFRADLGDLG